MAETALKLDAKIEPKIETHKVVKKAVPAFVHVAAPAPVAPAMATPVAAPVAPATPAPPPTDDIDAFQGLAQALADAVTKVSNEGPVIKAD